MKRTPMGYGARLKAAADQRRRAVAGKAAVILLAVATIALWAHAFVQA